MKKTDEIRLHKYLAQVGVASRRVAERLIIGGQVTVNGQPITDMGVRINPRKDEIEVEGRIIKPCQRRFYVMLNKPKGVIASTADPQKRPIATDFVRGIEARLYPVGRLDYHSEGLLLLTNDGEFAHQLMHPRFKLPKEYLVKVKGTPPQKAMNLLRNGIRLEDGKTKPCWVTVIGHTGKNSWLSITLTEGRNRQIRRMCQAVKHPVMKIKRVRYGNLSLGELGPGEFRLLTAQEIKGLLNYTEES